MNKLILPLLLLTVGFSSTAQAEIYKWTDEEGKVHYSATPPQGQTTKAEQIGDKIKFNVGKVQTTTETDEPEKATTTAATEETEAAEENAPTENIYKGDRTAARVAYCQKIQNNIHILDNDENANVVETGSSKPLEAAERAARLEKAKADLAKNCEDLTT